VSGVEIAHPDRGGEWQQRRVSPEGAHIVHALRDIRSLIWDVSAFTSEYQIHPHAPCAARVPCARWRSAAACCDGCGSAVQLWDV